MVTFFEVFIKKFYKIVMLEQIILEEIVCLRNDTNDSYYEVLLFSNSLNESVGWRDITSLIQKIVNKRKTLQTALKKFATATSRAMKKSLLMVILALMSFDAGITTSASPLDDSTLEQYVNKSEMSQQDISDLMALVSQKQSEIMDHQIRGLQISEEGKEFIKKHEGLSLKPYKLGDGMITIGYGHAEPIAKSWFRKRMNHRITIEQAEALFDSDIQKIEADLKHVLQKLRKEGVIFDITQSMYDAMVSMAFNMGPYGLETSKFIYALRNTKDPVAAAELIKISRIKNFRGLVKRRGAEYELFVRDLQMPT